MSFLCLRPSSSKDIIQKRERVNLIINYSLQSYLLFFKDKSYLHLSRQKEVLKEGKLQFVPTHFLHSKISGRILLFGLNDQSKYLCSCLQIEEDYNVQTRQISNTRPELSTKHFIVQSCQKGDRRFNLVRITKNVENGISIEVFDFYQNLWSQQILYLGSKFLTCHLINTHLSNSNYTQVTDLDCTTFVLVSLGDKLDSVNYSKIKIYHQKNGKSISLKTKFIITRQPKLKADLSAIIGCKQVSPNQIMLVGNSKVNVTVNDFSHSSCYVLVNTDLVQRDEPQQIVVRHTPFVLKNSSLHPYLLMRSLIGIVDDNILVLVKITDKTWGIARFNENNQQLLIEFDSQKPPKINISVSQDSLYSYESKLQYYFQKMKQAPTILQFNLLKIQRKTLQYQRVLKYAYPHLSEHFSDLVLHML